MKEILKDFIKLEKKEYNRDALITIYPARGVIRISKKITDKVKNNKYCMLYYKVNEPEFKLAIEFTDKSENAYKITDSNTVKVTKISEILSKLNVSKLLKTSNVDWVDKNIVIATFNLKEKEPTKLKTAKSIKIKCETEKQPVKHEDEIKMYVNYLKLKGLNNSTINEYVKKAKLAIKLELNENSSKYDIIERLKLLKIKRKTLEIYYSEIMKFLRWKTIEFFRRHKELLRIYVEDKYKDIDINDIMRFINKHETTIYELRNNKDIIAKILVEFYEKVKSGDIYNEIKIDAGINEIKSNRKLLEDTIK